MLVWIHSVFQCKTFFSEIVSPKNHCQVCLSKNVYQDSLIVSFNATSPTTIKYIHTGEQISSPCSKLLKGFATNLRLSIGVLANL